MRHYRGDPFWIRAKFGICKKCHIDIKGKRALYWPATKTILCEKCGNQEWQDFLSEAHDEDVYNGFGNPYAS